MKPTIRVFGHYGLPRLIESSAAGSVDSLGNPSPHSSYALLGLPCPHAVPTVKALLLCLLLASTLCAQHKSGSRRAGQSTVTTTR